MCCNRAFGCRRFDEGDSWLWPWCGRADSVSRHVDVDSRFEKGCSGPEVIECQSADLRSWSCADERCWSCGYRSCANNPVIFVKCWFGVSHSFNSRTHVIFCDKRVYDFSSNALPRSGAFVSRTNTDVRAVPEFFLYSTTNAFCSIKIPAPTVS